MDRLTAAHNMSPTQRKTRQKGGGKENDIVRVAVRVQQELQELVEDDFELGSRRGCPFLGSPT
jgi:hypothetical protein